MMSRWDASDGDETAAAQEEEEARRKAKRAAKKAKREVRKRQREEAGLQPVAEAPPLRASPASAQPAAAIAGAAADPEEVLRGAIAARDPLVHGCRSVDEYDPLNRIGGGTYGDVFRARCKLTGHVVALKRVTMNDAMSQRRGFPITALREANVLLALSHSNIIKVHEMVIGSSVDKVYMVMAYIDHDLKHLMETNRRVGRAPFGQSEVKLMLRQLLSATAFMHQQWYLHRDLKTSNLLYSSDGRLIVCDFGLARRYGSPLKAYTQPVITLWYRPPELLLGATLYSTEVDVWSVGCIFAEMLLGKPLMPGQGDVNQLELTWALCGTPTAENWPAYDELPGARRKWKQRRPALRGLLPAQSYTGGAYLSAPGLDLLSRMLALDPAQRISAADALEHDWFVREHPRPKERADMPVFAATNDGKKVSEQLSPKVGLFQRSANAAALIGELEGGGQKKY